MEGRSWGRAARIGEEEEAKAEAKSNMKAKAKENAKEMMMPLPLLASLNKVIMLCLEVNLEQSIPKRSLIISSP